MTRTPINYLISLPTSLRQTSLLPSMMYRGHTVPILPQGRRASKVRGAFFPIFLFVTLLLIGMLRFHIFFSSTEAPSAVDSTALKPVKTDTELEEEREPLYQQLQRIRDVETWRVLGGIQFTGEKMYYDNKFNRTLTTEANIAIFVQIAPSNLLLAPRLLSRIWHPDNIYCIHFDTKIPLKHANMFSAAIKSNPKLSNVFILPSTPVTYAGISMLLNTLESIHSLLKLSQKWDYYINLSGSDYPLVSATAIRRLLGRPDVLGSSTSFIHFSTTKQLWDELAMHRLGRLHFDLSLGFDKGSNEELLETDARHPVLGTGNLKLQIAKGEAWVIAHRSFCENAVHGNVARRLLALFANMQSSPEHFFQTLAWTQKELNKTVARHSFREILWTHNGRRSLQHPFYLDERSSYGSWAMWYVLAKSPNFFARKFRIPDSNLMDHIDVHKSGATDMTANMTAVSESFGIVKNRFSCVADIHSPSSRAYIMPCFWSGWRERGCKEKIEELCVGDSLEPPR